MTDLPVPRQAARERLARLGFEMAAEAALSLRSAAGYFASAGFPDAADTYRQLAEGVERDVAQLPTGHLSAGDGITAGCTKPSRPPLTSESSPSSSS